MAGARVNWATRRVAPTPPRRDLAPDVSRHAPAAFVRRPGGVTGAAYSSRAFPRVSSRAAPLAAPCARAMISSTTAVLASA